MIIIITNENKLYKTYFRRHPQRKPWTAIQHHVGQAATSKYNYFQIDFEDNMIAFIRESQVEIPIMATSHETLSLFMKTVSSQLADYQL